MPSFSSFIDLATEYQKATATPEFVANFGGEEAGELAIYHPQDEPTEAMMPDAEEAQHACSAAMATVFDLFRDTRLESFAPRVAWGFVHAFDKVAKMIETQEDRAARDVKDRTDNLDFSEIGSSELEKAQMLAQSLTEARAAMEAMRDHAANVYFVETGHPWMPARGSKVSTATTASRIECLDWQRARAKARRDQLAPEGPGVIFSGGQVWEDYQLIYDTLDDIKARIPQMILHTTAQRKGCDVIAAAWAARAGVPIVAWTLDHSKGKRAPFARNERLVKVKPVEAIVCEGSGIQANLAQRMRDAGVPLHIFRLRDQVTVAVPKRERAYA